MPASDEDLAQTLIPLSAPHLTGHEWDRLRLTSPTDWPAHVADFERELAQTIGVTFTLATHSGTAALELALRTLGIAAGDIVVCPTLTFPATANAITNVGAIPIFVGSEPTTWGLDPNALETTLAKLAQRPKAIIVVDLYGMPACWPDLQTVADRFGIPLIADAAESLGSQLNGRPCGTLGLLSAVSFNQNKIITASGGGALLTDEPVLFKRASTIANQGRREESPYEQVRAGGNYRMNPVTAAFGLAQLPALKQRVARRRAIFERYWRSFSELPGITFQPEPVEAVSNRWLTALTIDPVQAGCTRDKTVQTLKKAGIESRPVFWPLHQQWAFRGCHYVGDGLAGRLAQTGLCLPSGSGLSYRQVEQIITTLYQLHSCPDLVELRAFGSQSPF